MAAQFKKLTVTDQGDITIVGFVDRSVLGDANVEDIAIELFRLVDSEGVRRLVLDFSRVDFLSTQFIGRLLSLDRKIKAIKGKLAVCRISKEIYKPFEITKLDSTFPNYPDLASAIAAVE